jgi:hypothetical protein
VPNMRPCYVLLRKHEQDTIYTAQATWRPQLSHARGWCCGVLVVEIGAPETTRIPPNPSITTYSTFLPHNGIWSLYSSFIPGTLKVPCTCLRGEFEAPLTTPNVGSAGVTVTAHDLINDFMEMHTCAQASCRLRVALVLDSQNVRIDQLTTCECSECDRVRLRSTDVAESNHLPSLLSCRVR